MTLASGVITASSYSLDKVVHLALLGLFWGTSWLLLGLVAQRLSTRQGTGSAVGDQNAARNDPLKR